MFRRLTGWFFSERFRDSPEFGPAVNSVDSHCAVDSHCGKFSSANRLNQILTTVATLIMDAGKPSQAEFSSRV